MRGERLREERLREKEKNRVETALWKRGYRLVRLLGSGSFSQVWLVRSGAEAYFACKASDRSELLYREAEALRKLSHPLFPKLVEFTREESLLIMEYVEGENLAQELERRGSFSPRCVRQIGLELASGLAYFHERTGLAYRDMKPSNVILGESGSVKLVDFGCVCRLGEPIKEVAGSPGFAAPEQLCAGECLAESCDVYGLGRTLEALLGDGRSKFEKGKFGKSELGRSEIAKIELGGSESRKVARIIGACTSADRERRLPDMRSVVGALAAAGEKSWYGKRSGNWEEEILRGSLQVQKNIWKSNYKNS